jgi:hypothetical protein
MIDPIDIFLLTLVGLAAGTVGTVLGILFVEPFGTRGPRVLRHHFISASVVAVVIAATPWLFYTGSAYDDHSGQILLVTCIDSLATFMFATALISFLCWPVRVRDILAMAPKVKPAVTKHFDSLDQDKDGVLSRSDLTAALKTGNFVSGEERAVIGYVNDNINTIGHDVGSYYSYDVATRTPKSHTVAVISQSDLDSYVERIQAEYKAWL